MVGRATFAACSWMLENAPDIRHFYLESNFATDKKASEVNIMRTRGKRVTAECVIPRDVLIQHMRVDPETLHFHSNVANVGALCQALQQAAAALHDLEREWALVGGLAVSVRAEPRFTRDLDLAVAITADDAAEQVTSALIRRGFRLDALVE